MTDVAIASEQSQAPQMSLDQQAQALESIRILCIRLIEHTQDAALDFPMWPRPIAPVGRTIEDRVEHAVLIATAMMNYPCSGLCEKEDMSDLRPYALKDENSALIATLAWRPDEIRTILFSDDDDARMAAFQAVQDRADEFDTAAEPGPTDPDAEVVDDVEDASDDDDEDDVEDDDDEDDAVEPMPSVRSDLLGLWYMQIVWGIHASVPAFVAMVSGANGPEDYSLPPRISEL